MAGAVTAACTVQEHCAEPPPRPPPVACALCSVLCAPRRPPSSVLRQQNAPNHQTLMQRLLVPGVRLIISPDAPCIA